MQPGGEVRRFTDDRLLLRRAFADQIADDHQPGGDPDAGLKLDGFDIEATDRVDDAQPRPDRPLGIVLMRARIAEIDQDTVAHVLGDKPIEPGDDISDSAVIRGDHVTQILGIEACRQRGRADEIAEHHRQLPAFRFRPHPSLPRERGRVREGAAERADGLEQLAAVAPEHHAEILEIFRRELGQRLPIDLVVMERLLVSPQTQAAQPRRYVHQASPSSSSSAFASLRSGVSKPSVNQP